MAKRLALSLILGLIIAGCAHARAIVVKKVLTGENAGKQILTNGDLEKTEGGQIAGVTPWQKGYVIDTDARSGKVSARTTITDVAAGQMGLTYPVELNQKQAIPLTATLWSKAKDVSSTPDQNYSLYIDLTYMDGAQPRWHYLPRAFSLL
jgi:hypothetical protein